MATYTAPVDDIAFLLGKVFDFDAVMAGLPGYEEVNTDLAVSVLEEAGKFASGVLEPLNRPGDEEGCRLLNGSVSTPKGMADAYRAFADAGWCSLSGDPEYGGQGLPACAADPARRVPVRGQPVVQPVSRPHPRRRRGDRTAHADEDAEGDLPAEDDLRRMDGRHGADRVLGRHRSRPARHPRGPERRRQLRDHRHQDLHLVRRPRLRRQRHPPRARAPARRAEGREGHQPVPLPEVPARSRTAASARATPCRSARSSTRWASTPSPPA